MFDRIIVKKIEEDDLSTGGIALVGDSAREQFDRGVVIAVGPGRRSQNDVLVTMTVKPGDKVMFDRGIGIKIKYDKEDALLMFEGDLVGIIG